MPELPEMENYKNYLQQKVVGKTVTHVAVNREKSVNLPAAAFIEQVTNQQITAVNRRAKYLVFHLQNGSSLLLHLMLGGWMFYGDETDKPDHTVQVQLTFGDKRLYFFGLRLGYLHLLNATQLDEEFADLGPEPLTGNLPQDVFTNQLKSKRGKLKAALLDQSFIAGIGNRYSDEILWQAQLKPQRDADELNIDEALGLYQSIKMILQEAIKSGGYMDEPFFSGDGKTGGYKQKMRVHGLQGKPCQRCGTPIVEKKLLPVKPVTAPSASIDNPKKRLMKSTPQIGQ
ncbi:DNA-formamidopyrimidine glycosylase [Virgibacillus sp. 179-BFC.A HS]|uniref:DNA-formamidopyrimidine glycosylase n=1 Tax=Tigheibacillus jepli TaxID=3035914 RepID=A0ABU5CKI5_9BACI|nr:DNA-formamidopyrimidine glycosylase [Virgibacillus sp. 179-BFC.A HS]MDY0406824.1 DNA-formamidopyrimidine glycosylase [Virgibacillus sp. 179-BFC.A HS]